MRPLKVDERRARTEDGTDLAYHVLGEGRPVLLANGLGGSWKAWSHQLNYFQDRYRFISWDYRGLYRSGPPARPDSLRVEDHADDALRVMDAEGVERTAIFGWSMGVQVALELFRRAPDRVSALVLINGVAGSPWESAFGIRAIGRLIPHALAFGQRIPSLVQGVTERVVLWPETVGWAKRVGLASQTLDDEIFAQLAGSFAGLDMKRYVRILEFLGQHDASDILEEVDVPTLIVAGDRDLFTPRSAAERMARRIRGAELMVVAGGTHYVAVEYPELVDLRIEKFFRERGYGVEAG